MGQVGKLIGDQVGGLVLEEGGGGHMVSISEPKVGKHTTSTATSTRHEHEHDEHERDGEVGHQFCGGITPSGKVARRRGKQR